MKIGPLLSFTAAAFAAFRCSGFLPRTVCNFALRIQFVNMFVVYGRDDTCRCSTAWRAWRLVNYKHGDLWTFSTGTVVRESDIANLGILEFNQSMSMLEQIEEQVKRLSVAEQQALREWLDDILEDELEFTDEFKAKIEKAKKDIAEGRGRVVKP
jgi:hypothetical protein